MTTFLVGCALLGSALLIFRASAAVDHKRRAWLTPSRETLLVNIIMAAATFGIAFILAGLASAVR
jgi:hypothetical protein